jgi:hypothetical protein
MLVALLLLAAAGVPDLVVRNQRLDAHQVTFELVNVSQQPYTAWSISVVTHFDDRTTSSSRLTEDNFWSLGVPAMHPESGPLRPGEVRQLTQSVPQAAGKKVIHVSVTADAAIAQDLNAAGDPVVVSAMARERQEMARGMREAVNSLRRIEKASDRKSAVQAELKKASPAGNGQPKTMAEANWRQALQYLEVNPAIPPKQLADLYERQASAMEKHAAVKGVKQ